MVAIHAENFDVIKLLTAEVTASGDTSYDAMLRARPPYSETITIETAISSPGPSAPACTSCTWPPATGWT